MKILIIIIICFSTFVSNSFPIPKNNVANFDVIRKNKIIGSVETTFEKVNNNLIVTTTVDIKVKVLFLSAYEFFQKSEETWLKNNFISFKGHTDFEDDREYFIDGQDTDDQFVVFGMDGELKLKKDIIPLNYWNKSILKQKNIFDTQKGILRKITVKKLNDEIIKINKKEILTEKYLLNASKHIKDLGPFPEYTIWYSKKNGELIKFKFTNWKDKKDVITQRNDLDK